MAYKLAGYVKNRLEVVKTDVFRGFRPTPTSNGVDGSDLNTVIYALTMHHSNTGVQFSIEKYFRAVFDKLKKIDLGFSAVSGVSAVSATLGVHLLLKAS